LLLATTASALPAAAPALRTWALLARPRPCRLPGVPLGGVKAWCGPGWAGPLGVSAASVERSDMSGNPLIAVSYGAEDTSLGIKFAQVKARGDTLHIKIDEVRQEVQQKFPQLVRGACPHARRIATRD
jgi:hypothetical protein